MNTILYKNSFFIGEHLMFKTEKEVEKYLIRQGVIKKGHFVYTNGGHGSIYINIKDISKCVGDLIPLAAKMATQIENLKVDAIVGTPHGADTLAVLVALYYGIFSGHQILLLKAVKKNNKIIWYKDNGKNIAKKNIVIVEDVINTGRSIKEVVRELIWKHNGNLILCLVVCSRQSKQQLSNLEKELKAPIKALTTIEAENYPINLNSHPNDQCPLCKQGIPMNTNIGYGEKFLNNIKNIYPDLYQKLKK